MSRKHSRVSRRRMRVSRKHIRVARKHIRVSRKHIRVFRKHYRVTAHACISCVLCGSACHARPHVRIPSLHPEPP